MVDRGEDRAVAPGAAPGSRARGSRPASARWPGRPAPAISWSKSVTSWSTVIVGNVAGSTWWGTRSRTSAVSGDDEPARRRPGDDDADPEDEHGRDDEPDPEAAPRATPAPGRRRSRAGSRTGRCRPPWSAAPARAGRGSAGPRTRRPGPTSSPTLVPNSSVWGAMQERARDGDEDAEHDPPDPPGRHGLRVRDHEEQEDQDLGRGDDDAPEVDAADGRERPVRDHAVARAGEEPDADVEGHPEARGEAEQMQPPRDQQAAADDHDVGQDHPGIQRRPPEVERLDDACCRGRRTRRPARCSTG